MIRDRRTLLSVMLADLFVIAGAFFVLQDRYAYLKSRPAPAEGAPAAVAAAKPAERAETPPERKPARRGGARNILFSYRNSRPARVDVIGSFNDWVPQPMKRSANHTWTASFALEPGDYTYNYLVDGKVVHDPNNPRTAPEGRSLITVKPLE